LHKQPHDQILVPWVRLRRRWDRFDGLRLLELPAGETVPAAVARLAASGRLDHGAAPPS
jgi:hypothetical protein